MKTKIIATLGPASNSPETIARLAQAGVNVFRLNFSHGDASQFVDVIKTIRKVEKETGRVLSILQDLAGPKIRIGMLDAPLTFKPGDLAFLGAEKDASLPSIPFDNQPVLNTIELGDTLVMADGTLQFRVVEAKNCGFVISANNSGFVSSRKGLALPGKSVKVAALTEKDKKNLVDGLNLGVDAVALSFVQTPDDILEARAIINQHGKNIPLCAKLERANAVANLDAILDVVDIIMVARGDLGVECPLPKLPAIQKHIIRACNVRGIPVIVATQMLLSMVNNPSPTRAETTDVANAVLDGADCVMMSEETAMGKYPVESVEFMNKITSEAELLLQEQNSRQGFQDFAADQPNEFLSHAACLLARKAKVRAIVAHSVSGRSGRSLSAQRPGQDIHVLTTSDNALHFLNFSWGVVPHMADQGDASHLGRAELFIEGEKSFATGESFIITAGQSKEYQPMMGTNLVKVYVK